MNRISNTYGVLNRKTTEGVAVETALEAIRYAIMSTMRTHSLSTEEMVAFEHYAISEVTCAFGESIIRKGIAMRKEEKDNAKAAEVAAAKIVEFAKKTLVTVTVPAERKLPIKWCDEFGVEVVDADGWRCGGVPNWNTPISADTFVERYMESTVRIVDSERFKKSYLYQRLAGVKA
jgi:hypothetical protein